MLDWISKFLQSPIKTTKELFSSLWAYFFNVDESTKIEKELKEKQTALIDEALQNPDNAYLYGYATYVALYADQEEKSAYYKKINRSLLIMLGIAVLCIVSMAATSKVQPYVVGINQNGQVFDMNQNVTNVSDGQLRPKLAKAYMSDFVRDAFSVSVDGQVLRDNQSKAYAMTKGAALNTLKHYYETNDPREIAQKYVVSVEVRYVLPKSENTIQVGWTQITRDAKTADVVSRDNFVGEFAYSWDVKASEELVQKYNPLGFYINQMTISQDIK